MRTLSLLCTMSLAAALLAPAVARAQAGTPPPPSNPNEWETPPPLVPAPTTPATPPPSNSAPTPPPPGATPPPPGLTPGYGQPSTPYPYSPYGQPPPNLEEPPKEVGLMISESAFGMLTAAGVSLLPYYLLLKPLGASCTAGGDCSMQNLLFILVFSAVPLTVSQTQLSLANGSRYYYSESWPASLAGLGAEAVVLGTYFLIVSGNPFAPPPELLLVVGSVIFTPLVEMAVINLTKTPRNKMWGGGPGLLNWSDKGGLALNLPGPQPLVGTTKLGWTFGANLPLLSARF